MPKTNFFFILSILLLVSCSSQRKTQSSLSNSSRSERNIQPLSDQKNADGSSFEKAIFINKDGEMAGVDAEYAWLKENYPGYQMIKQSLVYHGERPYDILKITTKQGAVKEIYFDISKFFGKF